MAETLSGVYSLKIWLLTGCLSSTILVLMYFLKRVLDNFDERSQHLDERIDKAIGALTDQNLRVMQILTQQTFHSDRINSLEQRLDKNSWRGQ